MSPPDPMLPCCTVAVQRPAPEELQALWRAVGWGETPLPRLAASIAAYTATVCARDGAARLVGYASVFSDRQMTTTIGEFAVDPAWQRRGVGRAMMRRIEEAFPGVPIAIHAMGDSGPFYEALGFRAPSVPVVYLFKKPGAAAD